ncbi:histidinol dehydrogenase, partial [Streptomyces sp. NPDC058953]|uniref:histidinol dehydrogenase n=1 Tax=Streptomyces sp. NPDC058953 TaxID=3346676 RepID=UPI0036C0C6D5
RRGVRRVRAFRAAVSRARRRVHRGPGSSCGVCACHSSGLSVQSFLRGIHVVDYTRDALAEVTHHVVTLAEAEDLPAHGAALKARFGWKVPGQ